MTARQALGLGVSLLIAGGLTVFACSEDRKPKINPQLDASPVDASASDVLVERAEPPDPIRPADLPEGWELERKYDKRCNFYVPTRRELLPEPLRWEPCPMVPELAGVSCQLLAGSPVVESAWATPDRLLLTVRRRASSVARSSHFLVAEADGPIRTAILDMNESPCHAAISSVFGGRYTVQIIENSSENGGGAFGSGVDDLAPKVALHLDPVVPHSVYAGPFSILDLNKGFRIEQYAWMDGSSLPELWSPAKDNGLQQGPFTYASDALFWAADNGTYAKVNVYTSAAGVRPFLSAGLVVDHGLSDLGTDERDLVWIEARGRVDSSKPYDTYDIMTSSYVSDPAKLAPRRIRSGDGPGLGIEPFVVGCGYAARSNGLITRLVRLSDGRSWVLSAGAQWSWSSPLALTCTELFIRVGVGKPETSYARVRIDSLGPGLPAD